MRMTNIIFLFGTLAGLIVICGMIAVIVASGGSPEMEDHSVWVGYSIMLVALISAALLRKSKG